MKSVKILSSGARSELILPEHVLTKLGLQKGDTAYLIKMPDGVVQITRRDPILADQMEAAEAVMAEDRDALRALAK
ncbi:MAG: AbrB/MazE/SpoVT family DNA-binding domain-containing protein [Pseudomonadota bacterium]